MDHHQPIRGLAAAAAVVEEPTTPFAPADRNMINEVAQR
jgi:hypothetical protein